MKALCCFYEHYDYSELEKHLPLFFSFFNITFDSFYDETDT